MDRSTHASLQYIDAIEQRLHIKSDDDGRPFCDLSMVNRFSMVRLKNDLDDVLTGKASADARDDCRDFGQDRVQVVGFGLIQDFRRFIKLGLLNGERVILWDFIGGRILREPSDSSETLETASEVALNLIELKPLIERNE